MAAPPFKVKAVYEYASEHDDDLTFPVGQVITVTELEGDDWYVGEYTDVTGGKHEGLFPQNFVEKYEPEVPTRPTRPSRPKQEPQQALAPAPMPAEEEAEEDEPETVPVASKSPPAPIAVPPTTSTAESRSPASASFQQTPSVRAEPPPAPKPAPVEPAEPAATPVKKAPPPVAAKSNAFKDRIAAFNQPAAAPLAPMQPGRQQQPSTFIKKPFVAPPPSKNAYVPPPKAEVVHKPYVRDEDPEIKKREEEDRAAAEAAGFKNETPAAAQPDEDEDAPKPMTLKERMALLQKQQQEQAQRRADASQKKEKKPPMKKPSESSEHGVQDVEGEELDRVRTDATERQSSDIPRDKPRVPSASRRPPEPMSPVPAMPDHEILSDGHEADQSGAGEMTEDDTGTLGPDKDDSDDRHIEPPRYVEPAASDEEEVNEDEEEEEDEVDEETRRKEELRARMARLGGGMPGMGAPFNPFGAPPPAPARRKQQPKERKDSDNATTAPSAPQPMVPMVPVPGMQRMQSPDSDTTQRMAQDEQAEGQEDELEEEEAAPPPPRRSSTMDRGAPPPIPKDSRPVPQPPPPVPAGAVTPRGQAPESRAVPPPPPATQMSPGPGSESDDEMSSHARMSSTEASGVETPLPVRTGAPPVPGSREVPPRPLQSPGDKRGSYFSSSEPQSATSEKRSSRVPPPIPGGSPIASPRPPPPPPPTQAPPSRQNTTEVPLASNDLDEHIGSDYDGDYDTDIASSAKHKDALKAPHNREPSLTENTGTDDSLVNSPVISSAQTSAPRAVPPPPPQAPPKTRPSMDRPPPPVPPPRDLPPDEDYDPYRYAETSRSGPSAGGPQPMSIPPMPPTQEPEAMTEESSADDAYAAGALPRRSTDRAPPPPPQQPVPLTQAPGKAPGDMQRAPTVSRRSMEQGRPSGEYGGQIANDVDLDEDTVWWTAPQPLPPALQQRNGIDILSESEELSKSKRGGRKEITKDIYVLYMDYSQTVISVRYDSHDPSDVHLEQRHEPPPPRLRQDQLEAAWQQFGNRIAESAAMLGNSKKESHVGDGSPYSLPLELIKAQSNALLPVGTRAYGALVYANLANASTMQFDEIRKGDIVTVRNARFEGHHGAMKTKYKSDYGPNHVAIVEEWDGTRRAVRAWEQGREKKGGVRSEKFRLGDLRSGELRVWRVVGRDWVGWDS